MKKKYEKPWLGAAAAVALAASMAFLSITVPAAANADMPGSTAVKNGPTDSPVIDKNKTGSITIHKYDITAAEAAGEYILGQYRANGEPDDRVEQRLEDYAVQGVQFMYLKVGDIEQYARTAADGGEVCLVYEIPDKLRQILQMDTASAADMQAEGVSQPCDKTGVYHYTGTQIADALKEVLTKDGTAARNTLEEYLYSYGAQDQDGDDAVNNGAVNMPETDKNGVTMAENLPLGLYLIVETKVPEQVTDTVSPWFVSLPFTNTADDGENSGEDGTDDGENGGKRWLYDMVCYPKNQSGNPTLDKSVRNEDGAAKTDNEQTEGNKGDGSDSGAAYGDTATASGGDVLDYILVSRLPHISSRSTYLSEYTFTDQLSKGLTYNNDVKIALYKNAADAGTNNTQNAIEIWTPETGQNGQAYVDVEVTGPSADGKNEGTRMVIRMTEEGLKRINGTVRSFVDAQNGQQWTENDGCSDYYMVVYYTATVNTDATVTLGDEGNVNDVQLLWSRTNNTCSNSLQDRNYVYVYGIDLTKTFSDNKGDSSRVQFQLYNETDNCHVVAAKAEDGLYYVTGATTDKEEATVFVPAANGRLFVNNLEADAYQLTETATDDGYTLLRDPVKIDITATDREIIASVAGATGLDREAAAAMAANYGTGIRNENGQLVTEAISQLPGDAAVPGPGQDTPNGRAIGTTDMYEGAVHSASAKIDGAAVEMRKGTAATADETSENAVVVMGIVNHKGFLLPQTGGSGLYLITILGVLTAVAGGCMMCRRSGKKNVR